MNVVELNVGGTHYATLRETLLRYDSMLAAMFSGRQELTRSPDGRVFIDRDGKLFKHILQYLRDGDLDVGSMTRGLRDRLRREAAYFCLSELEEKLTAASDEPAEADCVILMVDKLLGNWWSVQGQHADNVPAADRQRITAGCRAEALSKLAAIYQKAGYRMASVFPMEARGANGIYVLFHKV